MTTFYEYNAKGMEKFDKDIVDQIPSSTLQSILLLNHNIVLKLSLFEYRICHATTFLAGKDCSNKTLEFCLRSLNKISAIKEYNKSEITLKSIKLIKDARNHYIHNFIYHGLIETSNIGKDNYSKSQVDTKKLMERMGSYQDFLAVLEVFSSFDLLYMLTGKKFPGENKAEEGQPKYKAEDFRSDMEEVYGDDQRLSDLIKNLNTCLSLQF